MDNLNFILEILDICNHKYVKATFVKLFAEEFSVSEKKVKRMIEDLKKSISLKD